MIVFTFLVWWYGKVSYVNDETLSQAPPIVARNHMLEVGSLTRLHPFHIRSEMPPQLLVPRNEIKGAQFGIHGNICSRFIVLVRVLVFFSGIRKLGGHWHVETAHEFGPAKESRVFHKEPRSRVVCHFTELWLAKKAAGHGHSRDTSELALWDVCDGSDIGVAHGALQRDACQNLKVA